MDWEGSNLQRQGSCNCIAGNWWGSGRKSARFGREISAINSGGDPYEPLNFSRAPKWLVLWRRLKKEKRKIFNQSHFHVPYDPYTYLQNFDQGPMLLEPEDLGRSFSARFADPTSVLRAMAR